ncbi:TetR family transcriptional regulator [Pasteurella langaaensis DSM 22999]|uniref:TetR family transcriptional regulator n=1 Tax=Alitibacter langaaensis DSM 22999 TaxID=1122935 RepID=A0A2U0SK35_9PAST|nr:TetR/AcrR family transcriptional regulator [Pasteurella langaaensis]PVX31716.1 TetR family transcriptional regulator [Pasteurella langaaensis DSM 22999]
MMTESKQPIENYRKKPKQSRSIYTTKLIFEATAQILQEEREFRFNTNAIAELAGLSVGTLYQYFLNKEAILLAMAKQELSKMTTRISEALLSKEMQNKAELGEMVVNILLEGFDGRQKMRKLLIEALIKHNLFTQLHEPIENILQGIFTQSSLVRTLSPTKQYIMAHSLVGTVRAAVLDQSGYLSEPEFKAELVKLFCYFVADD